MIHEGTGTDFRSSACAEKFSASGRKKGATIHALQDVSMQLKYGETIGIVGESGCGKSTLAKSLIGLVKPDRGEIRYRGVDLVTASAGQMKKIRRQIQMVFQDPYASLNPCMTVADLIEEPLILNTKPNKSRTERKSMSPDAGCGTDIGSDLSSGARVFGRTMPEDWNCPCDCTSARDSYL